jgi:hypothetical protein
MKIVFSKKKKKKKKDLMKSFGTFLPLEVERLKALATSMRDRCFSQRYISAL